MADIVIKAHLLKADDSVETRRVSISKESSSKSGIFKVVESKLGSGFPDLKNKQFSLMWKDSDGDLVLMSTNEEMQDAINDAGNAACKIFIQVEGGKDENIAGNSKGKSADKQQECQDCGQDCNEAMQEDMWGPFPLYEGYPPPPPPPPGMPFVPPPPPFGLKGMFNGHNGHGKWHRHGHDKFHGKDFPGHHHGYHHGHHHGHHHGRHHPWGRRARDQPFSWMHHGHGTSDGRCPVNADAENFCGSHRGRNGWKCALRDAVPLSHRRWVKQVIKNWRQQNLKNATTTSGSEDGSNQDISMESAGVPEAYAVWLNSMLPRWHRKWGNDTMRNKSSDDSDDEGFDKKQKKTLKASVPKEFRKWSKWYLWRHFGQREAPEFKECAENDSVHHFKYWKKLAKKQVWTSVLPFSHRSWTKKFIFDWRAKNSLDNSPNNCTTSSESDDVDINDEEETSVPVAYGKWLEKFLPRWHHCRGLLQRSGSDDGKGFKGQFKDTVPMYYRGWVKFYLAQRYRKQKRHEGRKHKFQEENSKTGKYEILLHLFQKKWVQEKKGETMDIQMDSSSDEDDTKSFDSLKDINVDAEKSFEKLSLSSAEEYPKTDPDLQGKEGCDLPPKYVRFDPDVQTGAAEPIQTERPSKVPLNFDFRRWALQALNDWDGETVTEAAFQMDAGDEDNLPPYIYDWLSKVMRKKQRKMMKMERKYLKYEMKASKKLAKSEMKAVRRAGKLGDQ